MENILYDQEKKSIKLIDFGVCRKFKKRGALLDMLTITGTFYYRAPEMFLGGGYREGVDVWAAGVLLYKLVCGKTPFESEYHSETVKNILEKVLNFGPEFQGYSTALRALVARMLNRNPEERVSACDCLKDVWFYPVLSRMKQKSCSYEDYEEDSCL